MAINRRHLRSLTQRTLQAADPELASPSGVNITLGTIAQESKGGACLVQMGGGPALGIGQMERPTYDWLQKKFRDKYPQIANRPFEDLEWDLAFAILMTRLRYRVVPSPLPAATDLRGMAAYWKTYYNTAAGAGTVNEFISSYTRLVVVF